MATTTISGLGTFTFARSFMNDGWVVTDPDGARVFYADRGGAWDLTRDGLRGRQTAGTGDVQAPRDAAAMRRFVRREFAQWFSQAV